MPTETKAAFARRQNVNRATVNKWDAKGLLVLTEDGLVDIEKTEWNLDQRPATYRGGTAHRPIRMVPKEEPDPREKPERSNVVSLPPRPEPEPSSPSDGADPEAEHDPDDPNLPLNLAAQRKENYLGLTRKQQFQQKAGELVDRAAAEKLFFETARQSRDAWTDWPPRVAIKMAEQLNVDPRLLTTILTEHVRQHLEELGEPEVDLPGPE